MVNQLRKKIEADPANPKFIRTEPWIGYRFTVPEESAITHSARDFGR
jgi:DNA-binding response OmpR family regulator